MIARLTGVLSQKEADKVIIDVHGVGYAVSIPFSTYYELADEGDVVSLEIYTHVREDALMLFGFSSANEKTLFTHLIQVSGIGPRLAIVILSGLPFAQLIEAISQADISRLSSIPGVGKKTAQRLSVELKEKVTDLFPETGILPPQGIFGAIPKDVASALVNLGYPRIKAETAVSRILRESDSEDRFDVLLKMALKELSS